MTRAITALLVLALALPALAHANAPQTNAPPGNSAIDEYLETVPGATGNTRPRPSQNGAASGVLSAAQRKRLDRLGPDGRTLADAVEATAPVTKPTSAQPKPKPQLGEAAGRSPTRELLDAVGGDDGGGGMGVVLPAILIAALLAAIAVVLLRRRTSS
jgi:hypothetical protein